MATDDGVQAVLQAAERLRTTAGWMLAALGAAAGAILVGTDLSALAKVTRERDLRVAVASVLLVGAASAWAIFRVAGVLAPVQHPEKKGQPQALVADTRLQAIVSADPAVLQSLAEDVAGLLNAHRDRVQELNEAQQRYVDAPGRETKEKLEVAQARVAATEPVVAHLRALSLYEVLRSRYRCALLTAGVCSFFVVVGAVAYSLAVYGRLGVFLPG